MCAQQAAWAQTVPSQSLPALGADAFRVTLGEDFRSWGPSFPTCRMNPSTAGVIWRFQGRCSRVSRCEVVSAGLEAAHLYQLGNWDVLQAAFMLCQPSEVATGSEVPCLGVLGSAWGSWASAFPGPEGPRDATSSPCQLGPREVT